MVKTALKGLKNRQALKETPKAVMTLDLLIKARDKLKSLRMSAERKRVIWTILTFLFLGSFRGSELLATDSICYDPMKTLCGSDLKLITMKAQGEDVETIQIRLKQPKTARTQPTQIVELPATGG